MTHQTSRGNVFVGGRATVVLLWVAIGVGGCIQQRAKPLSPDAFVAPHEVFDRSRVQPVDQPGPLLYEGTPPPEAVQAKPPAAPEAPESMAGVSPTVKQSVRPVREEGFQVPDEVAHQGKGNDDDGAPPATRDPAASRPAPSDALVTTRPAPNAATESSGGYQLVGTVLADVNSAPVFADKVLGVLDKALAAHAKQLDERPFRNKAAELIAKQVREFIANELEFALAKSKLDSRDQQLASAAATKWREDQITKAGGSPEVARQQFAAKGLDFEEQVEDQYRTYMVQLYYH